MNNTQIRFCKDIAFYINKFAKSYGIECKVGVLAQAIIESNYGESLLSKNYHNYFGMKCGSHWTGKSVSLMTREEFNGASVKLKDSFRCYASMNDGVKGYFDFINTNRYANLKGVSDYRTFFTLLKADGYATSSSYVNTLCNIVESNRLEQFFETDGAVNNKASYEEIANRVIRGEFGVGADRKSKLESMGYDYSQVQAIVNAKLSPSKPQRSLEDVAKDIVRGKYGNGKTREDKLREEGYDYSKGSQLRELVNKYFTKG